MGVLQGHTKCTRRVDHRLLSPQTHNCHFHKMQRCYGLLS